MVHSDLDMRSLTPRLSASRAETTKADLKSLIPPEYHDFLPLFSKEESKHLPPHRYIDHKIPVEEGKTLPYGPLYNMSEPELEALRKFLKENLASGFLRASSSPAASPILFVKKKDSSLRLCVDY